MYLSTSDYVQHKHAPGDAEANRFYGAVDRSLAEIDRLGATLVITADHGMRAKADAAGRARVIFLQDLVDAWLGAGHARVVLPITDPYVLHHGALGGCAMVYLVQPETASALADRVRGLEGVDLAVVRDEACRRFDLPADRTGDLVVFSDGDYVIGTRPADHDLSALGSPLRSHGGRAEQEVPMFSNRPAANGNRPRHNYDAFDVALNGGG
jgi:phosphonoacetate hydrolase